MDESTRNIDRRRSPRDATAPDRARIEEPAAAER
jgi:hypothetical protein